MLSPIIGGISTTINHLVAGELRLLFHLWTRLRPFSQHIVNP